MLGTVAAFNELIHKARPHKGQIWAAKQLRSLLHSETRPSEIAISHLNCGRVQDAYTLRFYCFLDFNNINLDVCLKYTEFHMIQFNLFEEFFPQK